MGIMSDIVTDEEFIKVLATKLLVDLHDIRQELTKDAVTVDEFSTPGGPAQTVYDTIKNFYQPIEVEFILAILPVGTTSATLQLGDRILPIYSGPALTAPIVFNPQTKIQLEWDDFRRLTIAPAAAGAYLEIMGFMTQKEMDRP